MLVFCDSFAHYAAADASMKYDSIAAGASIVTGRFGAGSSAISHSDGTIRKNVPAAATYIMGFAFKGGNPGGHRTLASMNEPGGDQVNLSYGIDMRLSVWRGGTLLGTSTNALTADVWAYVEWKVLIHASAGTVQVKVNGVDWINLTGQNTLNVGTAQVTQVAICRSQSGYMPGAIASWSDYYVCDTTGSVNNDFLGDCRVEVLAPSGAGNSAQFTPSAGSNYQNVDEANQNGDTDYNSSSTTTQKDTFAFGNLTSTSGTVKGVQHLLVARKTDAGVRSIAPVTRHSGTDHDGTTAPLSTSYALTREVLEQNPGTSAAWTISDVNAAEFGYKLTA